MTARSWEIAGPFGGQQYVDLLINQQFQTGFGWRMLDGALPVPLVGSALGHTLIVVLTCLEDWGLLVPGFDDDRIPCAFALHSGYRSQFPNPQKGYFIGVDVGAIGGHYTGNPVKVGSRVVANHGDGTPVQFEVESILGGASSSFVPKRGQSFVVNYNWDAVAQLVKLKQSFDSTLASSPQTTFVPTNSPVDFPGENIEFCLGHGNFESGGTVRPVPASPFFGVAAVYYSVTKTQWTTQEMVDFEEEIAAAMATDSSLPVPAGTTVADWTIFDSRMIVGNEWKNVGGIYTLRGNLFVGQFSTSNYNNQSEQLRNISFPKSGL